MFGTSAYAEAALADPGSGAIEVLSLLVFRVRLVSVL
jgi:hypothetical protein